VERGKFGDSAAKSLPNCLSVKKSKSHLSFVRTRAKCSIILGKVLKLKHTYRPGNQTNRNRNYEELELSAGLFFEMSEANKMGCQEN